MISVNLKKVETKHFPDGSQMLLDFKVYVDNPPYAVDIYWEYENDEECMTLYYLVNHIREHDPDAKIVLSMPYIPNARMDRVKDVKEVFTLKWFCKFINSLNFQTVTVLDPHSDVSAGMLDRIEIRSSWLNNMLNYAIQESMADCDYDDFMVFFPDAGAMKRYKDFKAFKKVNMIYGQKKRDWATGEILGLEIMDKDGHALKCSVGFDVETSGLLGKSEVFSKEVKPLEGKTILMVDDIISYGGTLYYSALELKELGAEHIFAYASHTENSVLDEEKGKFKKCLDDGTVEKLFTTSSIYHGKHDSIKIIG